MSATTLTISINRGPKSVYEFVSDLANLPKWATAFCLSIKQEGGEDWQAQTPQGPVKIRIAHRNDFGILDHIVTAAPGVEAHVPMRVVQNGKGSEVLFTLFRRPDMTDTQYSEDQELVRQDLATLKRVLER